MLTNHSLLHEQNQHGLLLTSVAAAEDGRLYASAVNEGIFRIDNTAAWSRLPHELPSGVTVNRLEAEDGQIFACTEQGLFQLREDGWRTTKITVPCYRLRSKGGVLYVATGNGLWYRFNDNWVRTSYSEEAVFDLFMTPQMIFMARSTGIFLFDRYTQSSEEFKLGSSVSSLCVLHGYLLGADGLGNLVAGDKRGRFNTHHYKGIRIFSLESCEGRIYACTSRGLYQVLYWKDRFHLCSAVTGFPVTDVAFDKDNLYLSTYFEGLRILPRRRSHVSGEA